MRSAETWFQAAGMYNTLLLGNDPALVVESLNGYRLKEKLPSNLVDYTVPLGVPEILIEGSDITLVSYGSTLRIVKEAVKTLASFNISCELIDVQTLLPFDINHIIAKSLAKTNRIIFIDEDVPGGAAAYMFNKVIEEQQGYKFLDAAPRNHYRQSASPGLCNGRRLFQQTKRRRGGDCGERDGGGIIHHSQFHFPRHSPHLRL